VAGPDGLKPKRLFDVRARVVFGTCLLLRVHVTMETNEVGLFIWSLCDGELAVQEIGARVAEEYGIDPEEAGSDTAEFMAQLDSAQMIEWV
jgi:hypothetical protein